MYIYIYIYIHHFVIFACTDCNRTSSMVSSSYFSSFFLMCLRLYVLYIALYSCLCVVFVFVFALHVCVCVFLCVYVCIRFRVLFVSVCVTLFCLCLLRVYVYIHLCNLTLFLRSCVAFTFLFSSMFVYWYAIMRVTVNALQGTKSI